MDLSLLHLETCRLSNKEFWFIAEEGKTSRLHRRWPFSYVHQEEGNVH